MAVHMTFDEIRVCLEKDGWPLEVLSESTARSRFRGEGRVFPVFVHCDGEFVTFAVIPYASLPQELDEADEVMKELLRFNRAINLAKFSVDEDGDIVLSVEYRLADLDPSEVRDAIDVLSFYAEKYSHEVA